MAVAADLRDSPETLLEVPNTCLLLKSRRVEAYVSELRPFAGPLTSCLDLY